MIRPIVCLLAATYALDPAAALAAPRTPCDRAEAPAVTGLADRLARSDDPTAWQSLLPAAAEVARLDSLSVADRACAAYVAGSAAFFLSASSERRRPAAAAAVRHFARAEALAPAAMSGRQPKSRLRTAWQRLGEVPGWLRGRRPVALAVPGGPPGTVRISPADPETWAAVCPGEACAVGIELPRGPDGASVSLRPGWYRVEHVGPCGAAGEAVEVSGGVLPVPDPAVCTAQIEAVDGEAAVESITVKGPDGAVDPTMAPVEAALTVEAPGYVPRAVTPPPSGGPLRVALERCPVTLEVSTRPTDARVEGAGPGPWGARTIRATAPGHGPVEQTVDVPPPEGCAGLHRVAIELPRPISVVGVDHQNRPVSIAKLVVQGEPVDPVGLYRVSGRYGLQAMHPTLGVVTMKIEVAPCEGADCGPVQVTVPFPEPPDAGPGVGPRVAWISGGVMLGLGALAGVGALGVHSDIQSYESKRAAGEPLDDLVERRDRLALAADVMFVGGALSMATGWLWSALAGDD